jgi:hypothetical protein
MYLIKPRFGKFLFFILYEGVEVENYSRDHSYNYKGDSYLEAQLNMLLATTPPNNDTQNEHKGRRENPARPFDEIPLSSINYEFPVRN